MTRGRPQTEWRPILVRFRPDVMTAIDDFRAGFENMTRVEAIHRLIRKGAKNEPQDPGPGPEAS